MNFDKMYRRELAKTRDAGATAERDQILKLIGEMILENEGATDSYTKGKQTALILLQHRIKNRK